MSTLRDFRRSVSTLKKQGLIPTRSDAGLKIDARSAIPEIKVKGKKLSTLIKKYDDIVSGKATALKVPSKDLAKYRRAGFQTTSSDRVIVPHAATEKARIVRGQVSIKSPYGIERVQIPVPFHNLKQYLRDIRKNADTINQLKGPREYFGIRFYGGQRANFYSTIQALVDDLSQYEAIRQRQTGFKQQEIYKHLEILRMDRAGAAKVEEHVSERKTEMSKAYNRRHAKRVREKINRDPQRLAAKRAADAERAREYRKRRKKNPKKAAKDRAASKKRAKKYRDNL